MTKNTTGGARTSFLIPFSACPALLVFYVPSESGEKVTLGISALLSMTVFLMTIRETLPPTEKTPLISLYYGVSICLVSFASGLAVVTLNLHHRGVQGTRVPGIVRSLVLDKLARIVFLNFQEEKRSIKFSCTQFASGPCRASQKKKQLSIALQTGTGPVAIVAQVRNQKRGK